MSWERRIENKLRRVLRLRPRGRGHVVRVSSASEVSGAGKVTARGYASRSTLDDRVAHLEEQSEKMQRRLDDVHKTLSKLPSQWQAAINQEADRLRADLDRAIEQHRDEHIEQRLLGVLLLAAGIILVTLGALA